MAQQRVVIRKYENRRLYDTAASRYVNLDEVAGMIRQGVEVEVLDARTGEDLTRVILTQIIVEDAKGRDSALPLDFLRQLVIASGRAGQEGFAGYMKNVFETYQRAYDSFQQRLRETAPMAAAPLDFMQAFFHPNAPGAAAPGTQPPPEQSRAPANSAEITELRRRLEELERHLAGTPRPARRPQSKRRAAK